MSVLSIIQNANVRLGLPAPGIVINSFDQQVLQFLALLTEECISLAQRPGVGWQVLNKEASFTTVATEIQGNMQIIAPNYKFVINDTIYNRSLRRPVFGPLSPYIWQQRKALYITGPWNQYRIVNNQLKFIPVPTAGQSCYFEYVTKAICTDSTGTIEKINFTADSDLPFLDEELLTLGLIWRWCQSKGFDFSTHFQKYEQQVINAIGRDKTSPTLNMQGSANNLDPLVIISAGNWPIS